MRFIIQRVTYASCIVNDRVTGEIRDGFCVFIGIADTDNAKIADKMIQKLIGMRIFKDENDKINRSLTDIAGSLLLISQFTLYANCRKGNRPSFTDAGSPEKAKELYEYIISECRKQIPTVETGVFGADMKVTIHNDGPFTIILNSDELAI